MVGIKSIVEALKNYGVATESTLSNLAKEDTVNDINNKLTYVSNNGSISATDNTSGFEISLNKLNKKHVNIYYNVSGASIIYVEVSIDNSTWRLLDKITTTGAKEDIEQYPWVLYPYVRVKTPTTGIDVTFEIVAV